MSEGFSKFSRVVRPYLDDEGGQDKIETRDDGENFLSHDYAGRDLPDATNRANESLRKAANHFSLAFHEDNRLLFLGDLENRDLPQVVEELEKKGMTHFQVLITPHHGTHWHKDLNKLNCIFALCSVGSKYFKNLRPEYKKIATECYATYFSGEVILSNRVLASYIPCSSRYFFPFF